MFNFKQTIAAAALTVAGIASANAGEMVLDSFDGYNGSYAGALGTNDGYLYSDAQGSTSYAQDTEVSPHGVVTATVVQTGGADAVGPVPATGSTGFSVGDGKLVFNNDDGVTGTMGLFYTNPFADINDPSTLLDLSSYASFYFDILSIDTSFELDLYVISNTEIFADAASTNAFFADLYDFGTDIDTSAIENLASGWSKGETSAAGFTAPGTIKLSFDDFVGDADFSAVTGIFAVLSGNPSADFSIAEVGVVPEPASLAVFGAGLLALVGLRRRKQA
ncbi:PEP-CTERM sorting domain-containing protein (plasmid) [Catenovulum sp. SX2]|uniref:PEP-CTERM sorting domain-containing protein n=1 Tax=Catenovulum sp. SX2 TaxID=3398614 RepID=UPI003F83D09E